MNFECLRDKLFDIVHLYFDVTALDYEEVGGDRIMLEAFLQEIFMNDFEKDIAKNT
ncbi:hypothetical protein [Alkalicoccobacillus porphyridii]|uniref:hypothetical protein n=1 Tax=Alkalicoccobacillus porphyridii TaxID=2597270 RepID=UPI00163DA35B|nr:hypothetical protein [Alkalicoccobacillus porphyridii]